MSHVIGGHQLFFDGMEHKLALVITGPHHHNRGHRKRELLHPTAPQSRTVPKPGPIIPASHRQLTLFDPSVRIMVRDGRPVPVREPPLRDLAEALEAVAVEVAKRHGWTTGVTRNVRHALRILLALQDTPGAPVKASDTRCLPQYPTLSRPVAPVLQVLAAAGMLDDILNEQSGIWDGDIWYSNDGYLIRTHGPWTRFGGYDADMAYWELDGHAIARCEFCWAIIDTRYGCCPACGWCTECGEMPDDCFCYTSASLDTRTLSARR